MQDIKVFPSAAERLSDSHIYPGTADSNMPLSMSIPIPVSIDRKFTLWFFKMNTENTISEC